MIDDDVDDEKKLNAYGNLFAGKERDTTQEYRINLLFVGDRGRTER